LKNKRFDINDRFENIQHKNVLFIGPAKILKYVEVLVHCAANLLHSHFFLEKESTIVPHYGDTDYDGWIVIYGVEVKNVTNLEVSIIIIF